MEELGVASRPGKGGYGDGEVGLVEKPWPEALEAQASIPSLPLASV